MQDSLKRTTPTPASSTRRKLSVQRSRSQRIARIRPMQFVLPPILETSSPTLQNRYRFLCESYWNSIPITSLCLRWMQRTLSGGAGSDRFARVTGVFAAVARMLPRRTDEQRLEPSLGQ